MSRHVCRDSLWATCPRLAFASYHAEFHIGCYQKHNNLRCRWPVWNQTAFVIDEEKSGSNTVQKRRSVGLAVRIFLAAMRTFTKDMALSEHGILRVNRPLVLNCALWYKYVIRNNKMHTSFINDLIQLYRLWHVSNDQVFILIHTYRQSGRSWHRPDNHMIYCEQSNICRLPPSVLDCSRPFDQWHKTCLACSFTYWPNLQPLL